jgi:UDP-2,4-diacetamido-2,4,6-trideoxy-beta-L-altropyranose hydrolase
MGKRFFFRADASSKVGLGHLTRCVALASMLRDKFTCCFLLKDSAEVGFNMLTENNFACLSLEENDLEMEALEVSQIVRKGDVLVIDGYQFTEAYFVKVKSNGAQLVLIDDFAKDFPQADVIINHAVDLPANAFAKRNNTRYCLGEKYAMLRAPFLKLAKQARRISKVERVFICFGGADYFNITLKTLQCLQTISTPLSLHVVLASTFPYRNEVEDFIRGSTLKVQIHYNLDAQQMADLMRSCEIAIAPTSGLSYEICAVGMGYIGGYYIDNQMGIHGGFLKRDCLRSVGDFTKVSPLVLSAAFTALVSDIEGVNALMLAQRKVVDGSSDGKFIEVFSEL